ncbi:DUF4328 domain-containing protein [Smaragdicoccus niigatensis]|uniref:DUF4328 domain-containing protein n=1 Tax=Smaragdicoccus niigatensis TaxID=359359 RepID=UPI00037D711B|nr:DUF4328 domain-containing protein [Smaragdicoccus niigatensis]
MLLAPSAQDTPAEHRNFRWVARGARLGSGRRATTGSVTPTPHYAEIPRWGLQDSPPSVPAKPTPRVDALANRAGRLLVITAVVFVVAALAEVGRYAILVYNRTRLVDQWLVYASDAAVWIAGAAAPALGLYSAVACASWLVRTRREFFARKGSRDPRSRWRIWVGCLVPGVNLVMPGVLLTELTAESDPRVRRLARVWWIAWVAGAGLAVVALLWRRADSLQAMADGVLLYAWTDLAAAGIALLTLKLIRSIEGRTLAGRQRVVHRLVPATRPARDVIEPIRPVTSTAKDSVAP